MKRNSSLIFRFLNFYILIAAMLLVSCEDFFDQESDHVMFAENEHLNNATDTIYSVTGIMKKLQVLADRTILLGEARSELVDITSATAKDLRNVAFFDIDDNNQYNNPRDYYAVINNCNYYLAHVDSALVNSRNDTIFSREIAAVKCYRAWTYLQLAMNYGRIPFVTEPIITKEEAEIQEKGELLDIQTVCNRLIQDITPVANDVYLQTNGSHPFYGDIGYRTSSMFFYFPANLLLGELNLWAGNYKKAAEWYYRYISERNGDNSTYPTGLDRTAWSNSNWTGITVQSSWPTNNDLVYSANHEIISVIPGDSIPRNGTYLQLRNIFNSSDPVTNEYHEPSLVPSQGLIDLSAAQVYCLSQGNDTIYAPSNVGFDEYQSGDLRLYFNYRKSYTYHNDARVETQAIVKHRTRNAIIWRRQMVYLHMAEALNHAGYPRFAYQILARGLSNKVIREEVLPYYTADSTWIKSFNFPDTRYLALSTINGNSADVNMQGIHSRGSGLSYINQYYKMPYDEAITDSLEQIAYQQDQLDKMIADESALEFAFEGQHYYNLVRMALYRDEPSFLADRIYGRRGESRRGEMEAEIKVPLTDKRNWFLHWQNKIGY